MSPVLPSRFTYGRVQAVTMSLLTDEKESCTGITYLYRTLCMNPISRIRTLSETTHLVFDKAVSSAL